MNTLSTKITALVAAVLLNGVIMAAVGYCFALQSNTHMSVITFAKAVVAHQWLS
jgi:hypothetical protein